MVASPEQIHPALDDNSDRLAKTESPYQEEMCEKLIQLSFAKIVNSKSERGGARLHKNLLILHLLQKARLEQRNKLLYASVPVDTTSRVSGYQHPSSHYADHVSRENSAVASVGNADEMEQMQRGRWTEEGEGDEEEAEEAIEIDDASGQQQAIRRSSIVSGGRQESAHDAGTFSTYSYDDHLASPCLSSSAPGASPESGFDGNYCSGTTLIQRPPSTTESRQQATSRQTGQSKPAQGFDFSIDVNDAANVELHTTHDESVRAVGGESATIKRRRDNGNWIGLRHHSDQPRHYVRHRCRRSVSVKSKRTHSSSASSSSSSSDSDESSSEESFCPVQKDGSLMESGENKKSRDCLKRKLDDNSCAPDSTAVQSASCEWYSSPKVACIVHGTTVADDPTDSQRQNLSGLISVLQSAALTSDEPTEAGSNTTREENTQLALAVRVYDPGDDGSLPLTRSLSCPGFVELACES